MRPSAGSCRSAAAGSCSSQPRPTKRLKCWTKPPRALRRAWSGRARGGASAMNQKLLGVAGIIVILLIAFALSTNRRAIRPRVIGAAFALQAFIAWLVIYTSWGRAGIQGLSNGVANLLGYASKGTEFLFGPSEANPLAHSFAIAALPVIIFFASLVAILYYLGIMQRIVRWVGGAIGWVTGISRVESLSAAANIFVGQSESPSVVRPYLAALPPSRLFTVM